MKTNTYVFSEVGRWHLYLFNQVCVNLLVVCTKKFCFIWCDILCRFPIILALVEGSSTLVSGIQNNQLSKYKAFCKRQILGISYSFLWNNNETS